MKFTKTTIEICGKDFKYANCTNHDLLKHQKAVEKEKDLYKPLLKESKELENEIRELDVKIRSSDRTINAINRKDEPSDKELDMVIKESQRQIELEEQRKALLAKGEEFDAKYDEETESIRNYLQEKYAELAELQLEEMTKEFYLENATSLDSELIRLLAPIRQMSEVGLPTRKIEKFVRDNIQQSADSIVESNKPSFQ